MEMGFGKFLIIQATDPSSIMAFTFYQSFCSTVFDLSINFSFLVFVFNNRSGRNLGISVAYVGCRAIRNVYKGRECTHNVTGMLFPNFILLIAQSKTVKNPNWILGETNIYYGPLPRMCFIPI